MSDPGPSATPTAPPDLRVATLNLWGVRGSWAERPPHEAAPTVDSSRLDNFICRLETVTRAVRTAGRIPEGARWT